MLQVKLDFYGKQPLQIFEDVEGEKSNTVEDIWDTISNVHDSKKKSLQSFMEMVIEKTNNAAWYA